MKVRITWPDGTKTEEFIYQHPRPRGEMEQRSDYYIIKHIRGLTIDIPVDELQVEPLK